MEEILASIRRIIADDDPGRALAKENAAKDGHPRSAEPAVAARPVPAPPRTPPPLTSPAAARLESAAQEEEIDSMLAQLKAPVSQQPADAVSEANSDILDLTEQMASEPPPAPAFRTIDGHPDIVFEESPPEPPPVPAARVEPPPQATADTSGLMSLATTAAVDSAFNTLAQTVLVQNARTLEDLVREMLRPMLKSWLDDNLPSLVERLVRAEIERVSRGRG
jgi:cell pole-organizing protein PopZ